MTEGGSKEAAGRGCVTERSYSVVTKHIERLFIILQQYFSAFALSVKHIHI